MPLFSTRDLVQFPQGANSSDVLINGVHFNYTTLSFFNYTLYDNGTLSNGSSCYLTLKNIAPFSMLANGTFINGTSCYIPYYGIRKRGSLGIVFACLFALSIMFTLVNLRKHGRLFLPSEKRFRAIGRRWQWYWMLFVAGCGIISTVSAVDVDSDYLQNIPIMLFGFFYYLMVPGVLAVVWEGVRHWGSWQERQIYDHDPFSLPQEDRRGTIEFYLPLVFYLLAWLNFFMNIPRGWTNIKFQGSQQQIDTEAKPTSTDTRFKAAGFLAFLAWCIICYSLQHSIHYYKPKNRGPIKSFVGFLRYTPTKFMLTIPLLLIFIGYTVASAFLWEINPLKFNVDVGWLYGLGYGPVVLILLINETWGYLDPNEDRALLKQRAERGRSVDEELGIGGRKKPTWWSKGFGGHHFTAEQRLKAMTTEVGGGRPTARNIERTIELGNMPVHAAKDETSKKNENPFRDNVAPLESDRRPVLARSSASDEDGDGDGDSGRAMSQMTVSTTASRPQQIRSMLDI